MRFKIVSASQPNWFPLKYLEYLELLEYNVQSIKDDTFIDIHSFENLESLAKCILNNFYYSTILDINAKIIYIEDREDIIST